MKRYLIQIKGFRSSDSSHRVARFVVQAKNLKDLCETMSAYNQDEIEILGVEEMSVCDLGIHSFKVMFDKGECTLCGEKWKGKYE